MPVGVTLKWWRLASSIIFMRKWQSFLPSSKEGGGEYGCRDVERSSSDCNIDLFCNSLFQKQKKITAWLSHKAVIFLTAFWEVNRCR